MITRDADLTRLLDRLETRHLVARARQAEDRRVVLIVISEQGLALLAELDPAVFQGNKRALGHVSPEGLRQLIELLELARESADEDDGLLTK